jgi:hypothetical protein
LNDAASSYLAQPHIRSDSAATNKTICNLLFESEKLVPVTTGAELDTSRFLVRVGAFADLAEFLFESIGMAFLDFKLCAYNVRGARENGRRE